jgi:hypothetical protein
MAMSSDREEKIRRRAYDLWEIEGRPEGRHHEHWERAAREVEAEEGGSAEDAEIPEMPEDFPEPGGRSGGASGSQPDGTNPGSSPAEGSTSTGNTKRRSTGTTKRPGKSA